MRQVGRRPAVSGRRARDRGHQCRVVHPFRGRRDAVIRGPVSECRRARHRTTAQHGVQRQHTDRHHNTPPVAAAAVAAAAVRPFHHDFRPLLGGTWQGTAGSGSVATDAGARFARRPHVDDGRIILLGTSAAGQSPKYRYGVFLHYEVARLTDIARIRSYGDYVSVFVIQKLKKQLFIFYFFKLTEKNLNRRKKLRMNIIWISSARI